MEKYRFEESQVKVRKGGHAFMYIEVIPDDVIHLDVADQLTVEAVSDEDADVDSADDEETEVVFTGSVSVTGKGDVVSVHSCGASTPTQTAPGASSPTRDQPKKREKKPKILKMPAVVSTRWNSMYYLLHRAIEVREAIKDYFQAWTSDLELSTHEWTATAYLVDFLNATKIATKR